MTKVLVNYADGGYFESQRNNSITGTTIGCFDRAISFNRDCLGDEFSSKFSSILAAPRGAGYWLWKPYVILESLHGTDEGDIIFYCDSGSFFVDSIDKLIESVDINRQPIIPFGVDPHKNSQFTKADVFVFNDCVDDPTVTNEVMVLSSFHLIRNCQATRDFYQSFLFQCCQPGLIDDSPNVLGFDNFPDFIDHRHDQSIYSVLCRKAGLEVFRDPSQYGEWSARMYSNSPYPTIIAHTRDRR